MSDHSRTLVPLESWCYQSPDTKIAGSSIDIGLFAEALVHYDKLYVNLNTQPQFAEFITWFIKQGKFPDLRSLFRDGTLVVYEYSFVTAPVITPNGNYDLWNIEDELQAKPDTFEERFLYHKDIQECFERGRHKEQLYKSLRDSVIEVKASEFGRSISNAKADILDERRNALIVQAFIDEVFPLLNLGDTPEVDCKIKKVDEQYNITWNVDFNKISQAAGEDLNVQIGAPYAAAGVCNRLLWSAANLSCDLYLGKPMSILAGDKLYESALRTHKIKDVIEQLEIEVEYPDIRALVNAGKMNLDEVLHFRKKAVKFRRWLQEERDRDRNTLIAYLHEAAIESGWTKTSRKTLNLLGVLGPTIVSGIIGTVAADSPGGIAGSAGGATIGFLFDLGSKIGTEWKPLVFGNWAKKRIERLMERDQE